MASLSMLRPATGGGKGFTASAGRSTVWYTIPARLQGPSPVLSAIACGARAAADPARGGGPASGLQGARHGRTAGDHWGTRARVFRRTGRMFPVTVSTT